MDTEIEVPSQGVQGGLGRPAGTLGGAGRRPQRLQAARLAAACIVLASSVLPSAACSLTGDDEEQKAAPPPARKSELRVTKAAQARAKGARTPKPRTWKACPRRHAKSANFTTFYVGPTAGHHRLQDVYRACGFTPQKGKGPQFASHEATDQHAASARLNFKSFVYGECRPPPAHSGAPCAPPVEIQVAPACERNLSLYGPSVRYKKLEVRGASGAYFPQDPRLEIYTGEETITIFGSSEKEILAVAEELRSAPGSNETLAPEARLPPPAKGALEGELRC